MNKRNLTGPLIRLAGLYGVQTAYYGVNQRRHTASPEGLLAVLQALGAPVGSLNHVPDAIRERELYLKSQVLEPVTIAREEERPEITVTLPAAEAGGAYPWRLELESGAHREGKWSSGDITIVEHTEVEGKHIITGNIRLPGSLPYGYHKIILEIKGKLWSTTLIVAPERAFSPPDADRRDWGAFIPLYALKTARDQGSGDYTSLGELTDWVAREGGNVVGTLPLLPVFLDNPYEPSPYAPVSRLLWNEFYIDVTRAPEFSQFREAQEEVSAAAAEIEVFKKQTLVDYRRLMALKRRVMEKLCNCLNRSGGARHEAFRKFVKENPAVAGYARFRAVMERQRQPWQVWPPRLREGDARAGDYDEDVNNFYLYSQWLAAQQVASLAEKARQKGIRLYFDLPLGVHPDGYDAWRHQDIFAGGVSAGAPPDPVFTTGQDWGFPPLHPEKVRAQGYRYIREYLHHHLKHASMLRIDHVMGLHRLYWIPRGFTATQGVYVRYPAAELYAVLALESYRHRSIIVGEDLGIVPRYVRRTMARHGLHRMYVLYYELADTGMLRPVPRDCVAGLNTHDMPPFAAFWEGEDIREKSGLGLLNKKEAKKEEESRHTTKSALTGYLSDSGFLKKAGDSTREALHACLAFLSAGRARTVLLNLEDLWLETRSQNIPGSGDRFPAWRRRARYALEEFCGISDVNDILVEVNELRKRRRAPQ